MITSASLCTSSFAEAQCFAVALAIKKQERKREPPLIIISGSQDACSCLFSGYFLIKLKKHLDGKLTGGYSLIWCPGEAVLEGKTKVQILQLEGARTEQSLDHTQLPRTSLEEPSEEDNNAP